jgi:threonine dehydratase
MFDQIQAAKARLKGWANVTPTISSRTLNKMVNAEVFFKCENLQRVGAFKFRGAFNSVSQLSEEQKANGVIAYSSGNHGQAIASVCQMLGIKATVVMPSNAPAIKRVATEGYGATIIEYDPQITIREDIARKLALEYGYTTIPPFDHEHVIAGQGTAALELFDEVGDLDLLLTPCGGGGLLSGSAISAKAVSPKCRVIGIEPELADDATRSFRTGELQTVQNPPTIADGTRTPSLGRITFPLVLKYVDDMQTVSESSIMEAVKFFFYRMKQVVEPSGALGLAALMSKTVQAEGKIGVIISGGNIDAEMLTKILNT